MRYQRNSEVVHRNGFNIVVGVLATGGWIAAGLIAGPGFLILWGALAPFVLYFLVLRPRVVLADTEVRIVGSLVEEAVPYMEIEDVRFSGRFLVYFWLQIHHTGGWPIDVLGPIAASALPLSEPRWQRPLQEELLERIERARSMGGSS